MVDEPSEEQLHIAVAGEDHENYFVPEGMLEELRLNHVKGLCDEAQTVEHGEAYKTFDLASHSWENV